MNLRITEVKVTDAMNERAKTCTLTLAPPDEDRQNRSVAEVRHPGDTQSIVATNIRPNNSIVEVRAAFGGLPSHTIFAGVVELMDDLEDPDKNLFVIELSATPANQGHRKRINMLRNSTVPTSYSSSRSVFNVSSGAGVGINRVSVSRPTGLDRWTSTNLLNQVCQKAGIKLGRNDLPTHNIWGTYEVIRKNPMEVAEELCAPFNTFDFQRYFVRCDETNGLQIIKVDYTKGAGVTNPYPIQNLEQKSRSYARYMPENRIGDSDVVCRGADIYGNDAILSTAANVVNKEDTGEGDPDPNASKRQGKTVRRIAEHTYRSSSESDNYNPYGPEDENPTDLGDSKTETESVVSYVCMVTMRPEVEDGAFTHYNQTDGSCTTADDPDAVEVQNPYYDPSNTDDSGGDEPLSLIFDPPRDIDTLIGRLAEGRYTNISLSGQYVRSTKTRVETKAKSMTHVTETTSTFNYDVRRFDNRIYKGNDADVVLVSDETITSVTINNNGKLRPMSKVNRSYKYSSFGVQSSITTKTYTYTPRDTWALVNVEVQFPDGSAATGAEIAYYADRNAEAMKEREKRWREAYNEALERGMTDDAAKEYADNQIDRAITTGGISRSSTGFDSTSSEDNRVPIGRYTLLNGHPVNVSSGGNLASNVIAVENGFRPTSRMTYVNVVDNSRYQIASIRRNNLRQTDPEDRLKSAFEINVPYMDLSGLMLLWNLAQKQKELEKNNAYWEIVRGTCPIDTTPAAGASVNIDGSGGIAESVVHIITEDEAMTTVELRRLVW